MSTFIVSQVLPNVIPKDEPPIELFRYAALGSSIFTIATGTILFRILLRKTAGKSLTAKCRAYLSAFIIRGVSYELPALFSSAVFLITKDWVVLAIPIVSIALILINFPRTSKVITDLQLEGKERRWMENPDTLLYTS